MKTQKHIEKEGIAPIQGDKPKRRGKEEKAVVNIKEGQRERGDAPFLKTAQYIYRPISNHRRSRSA